MTSTPSIRISQHRRFRSPFAEPDLATVPSPMAIPHAREHVPPPLPPPPYIPELSAGQDPGWQWGNDPNRSDFGRPAAVKHGSSLLGGGTASNRRDQESEIWIQRPYDESRRGSSISTITGGRSYEMVNESLGYSEEHRSTSRPPSNYGYVTTPQVALERTLQKRVYNTERYMIQSSRHIERPRLLINGGYRLQSERQLGQWTLEESSQSYDKQLLNSLGGPNTPKRGSTSSGLETLQENQQLAPHEIERRNSSLRPLCVPERRHNSVDSPSSSRIPSSGAVSPGFTSFWPEHGSSDGPRALTTRHSSLTFDDSISHRGSYDHTLFLNDEYTMEEGPMSNLNIHDRSPGSPKSGSKRRASSPPRERGDRSSLSGASGHSEIYHRRSMQQLPSRSSPVSRFHPNHSSVSSASSYGPRHGSFGSSLSIPSISSSATSYASGRVSPGGVSPAVEPETRMSNAYSAKRSGNQVAAVTHHQRAVSENVQSGARKPAAGSTSHSRHGSLSQMQGLLICDCCPKKPKKFDTEEELRLHETEKQYTCLYCTNRFKNKNEAERHQNSLHLRKHSWSCAVLSGIEAAFHTSSNGAHADACGYCGKEFSNPPQWDIRADHLNNVHKFGECNQSKKFFRADHFRQHLKHSHHGTSGKWTNMLENACMKDEPLPIPLAQQDATASGTPPPPTLVLRTAGLSSTGAGDPGTARIDETPLES